jgi:hypothetical protein
VQFLLTLRPVGLGVTPTQTLARLLFQRAARGGHREMAQVLATYGGIDNSWLAGQPQW